MARLSFPAEVAPWIKSLAGLLHATHAWRLAPLLGGMLFAIDDTPTKRYGPHVDGAGIHHNPTPGPAEQKYVYGHVWVTLSWVVRHSLWGTIGLPLLACLYVRRVNMADLPPRSGVKFETKLEQAAGLVEWLAGWLKYLGKTLWVVVDGAYIKTQIGRAHV